jgi:FAD/FMN-containing dehydrogenase
MPMATSKPVAARKMPSCFIATVRLRLTPRRKLERVVELMELKELIPSFERRIADGFLYGDFQYSTDTHSRGFLRKGVFSCYRPVDAETPIPKQQKELSARDLKELIHLAHTAKGEAFRRYADHYLATSGQMYWSDTHQLSTYLDDYHRALDRKLDARHRATEIITEIYVPREDLPDFMDEVRTDFRNNDVNVIYGTIRLTERDDESFLAWAKQPFACIIFNLHTVHTREGLEHSAAAFRRLIDMAIPRGGSYYLTYHKCATRDQVLACYPQFPEFLRLKRRYDPQERFQSDWYRHYRRMFADAL